MCPAAFQCFPALCPVPGSHRVKPAPPLAPELPAWPDTAAIRPPARPSALPARITKREGSKSSCA